MTAFKKALHRSTDIVAGIDFGTTKICTLIGHIGKDGMELIGIGKQPSLGIRKGVVVNIQTTVEAIKKSKEAAELMAGCKVSSAYIGIAGGHIKGFNSTGVVAIKNREVSETDVERALDAARAVAIPMDREVIHVIPQEYRVNEQDGVKDPIGMFGVRLESKVHIVTGAQSSRQNLIKCANQAGVQVSDIVLEPLACAEAILTKDEKELGVVVVDIGGGTTDIAIFVRGSVAHTGVIAMGGNHVTNDVAVGLRTSIQDAENIKIRAGSALSSSIGQDEILEISGSDGRKPREISKSVLTKIIEPRMEEILTLVNQEIKNSGFKHLLSAGVVMTGGASLLDGITELAEFIMELPVRRGMPMDLSGLSDAVSSPIYSTGVGLLLYGTKHKENARSKIRDENLYTRVLGRVRNWLGEVV